MHRRAGQKLQRVFPSQHQEAEKQVYNLQKREGLHCGIQILRQEIEEDLGPEKAFDRGKYLIFRENELAMLAFMMDRIRKKTRTNCCSYDYQASPVVLDEFSHDFDCVFFSVPFVLKLLSRKIRLVRRRQCKLQD